MWMNFVDQNAIPQLLLSFVAAKTVTQNKIENFVENWGVLTCFKRGKWGNLQSPGRRADSSKNILFYVCKGLSRSKDNKSLRNFRSLIKKCWNMVMLVLCWRLLLTDCSRGMHSDLAWRKDKYCVFINCLLMFSIFSQSQTSCFFLILVFVCLCFNDYKQI